MRSLFEIARGFLHREPRQSLEKAGFVTKVGQWIYQRRPSGEVAPEHYQLEESDVDLTLVRGEVVVEGNPKIFRRN